MTLSLAHPGPSSHSSFTIRHISLLHSVSSVGLVAVLGFLQAAFQGFHRRQGSGWQVVSTRPSA